jgi:hypothetical protein
MPHPPTFTKEIEKVPPPAAPVYVWADFVELLCLHSSDGRVSAAGAAAVARQHLKEGGAEPYPDEDEAQDAPEEEDEKDQQPSDIEDKWTVRANDWFKQLAYRAGAFKESYPFVVSKAGNVIELRDEVDFYQLAYLFLLLASNLRHFNKSEQNTLADTFEIVSFHALKNYLPENSVVHIFGKNPLNEGEYSGKFWLKVKKLSEEIKERLRCCETDFSPSDTGDGGLDLVAWLPMDDSQAGILLVFGQCTCKEDWVDKQWDSHVDRWNYIDFMVTRPRNFMFIPICFRSGDGSWDWIFSIKAHILIDRVRMVRLLKRKHAAGLESYIDKCLREVVPGYSVAAGPSTVAVPSQSL